MKVKVTKAIHDVTVGKVYDVAKTPHWAVYQPFAVWVVDDVGEDYILYEDEFEWVSE